LKDEYFFSDTQQQAEQKLQSQSSKTQKATGLKVD